MRIPASLRAIANWSPPSDEDWSKNQCFFDEKHRNELSSLCTPAKRVSITQILLWGDSHAAHLYPGLTELHANYSFDLIQWTSSGCPPVRAELLGEFEYCIQQHVKEFQYLSNISPNTVVLAAAWERYLEDGSSEEAILSAIKDTILSLKNTTAQRIVLFGPAHTWMRSESEDLFLYMLRRHTEVIPKRIGGASGDVLHLDAAMAALAASEHVVYLSVVRRFCDATGCLVQGDRSSIPPDFLFMDQDHLTANGSHFLMETAAPLIFGRP
jgi:hypothetical protein